MPRVSGSNQMESNTQIVPGNDGYYKQLITHIYHIMNAFNK